LEGGTQPGAIGAVFGLNCDVICNAIIIVKWFVAPCMSLVGRSQESDVCRCCGSCNVVGIQIRVLVGGESIERARACITIADGSSIGTLGSGVAGDCGVAPSVMACQW
jgi:hypothetical protein